VRLSFITLLGLVAMPTAYAQSSPKAEAESLFRQGRELMEEGKVSEACAAFHESQQLDPSVSTQLNEANCREKNGQLATAWGLFIDAERQSRAASDEATQQLHQVALERSTALEPRVSKLTVSVSAESRIDRLEILRGSESLRDAAWNRALPIDGGTYKIRARAPGAAEWTTEVTVGAERDSKTVDIPKLQVAVVTETPTPSAPRSNVVPLAVSGGAIVLLAVAIGFELSGESTYDKAQLEPDPAKRNALWQSANTRRYVGEAFALAGIATAGIAVWLYLRGRDDAATQTAAARRGVHVQPIAAADHVGIQLLGRY
jgi:hypothetical protein